MKKKLHFSIDIKAPVEKVWDTMISKETYVKWTKAFNPGSYYVGSWDEGSEIRFLGADLERGSEAGMYARIKKNDLHKFISIEHLGFIEDGVVDTQSEKVKDWVPAFENYTFVEKDGGTELSVDIDITEEYEKMFEEMWPAALKDLKTICERG